jgi:hypothetical protein
MISQRPKRRASSENAPGPGRERTVAMTATKKIDRLVSNRLGVGTGSQESAKLRLPIPARVPANGVRNPIRREASVATARNPTAHVLKV